MAPPAILLAIPLLVLLFERDLTSFLGISDSDLAKEILRGGLLSAICFATAFLLIRLLHIIIWEGRYPAKTGSPAPRLFTDLVDGLVVIAALVVIIAFVLDKPVTGLVATSGVMVAVVGFALKSMISDLFSGIAITMERPFRLGDWIEINNGAVGKVLNMSWRATGLMLESGIYVVVPNGRLSEMTLRVYDRPETAWRDEIDMVLPYDVDDKQVERVLLSAAHDVPEITAVGKKADIRIVEFGDHGVKWRLRYWVPDYPTRSRLRFAVQRNLLRNLHFAGIATAAPRVHTEIIERRDDLGLMERFLGKVSLFRDLRREELSEIAGQVQFRVVRPGAQVVRRGEEGASLFVVKEGGFEVVIADAQGQDKIVARLSPGSYFGEMSLLTGAPRGATVRAAQGHESQLVEIHKTTLAPILAQREDLFEAISKVLAERQLQNDEALAASGSVAEIQAAKQTLAQQLLGRMRGFFGFSRAA